MRIVIKSATENSFHVTENEVSVCVNPRESEAYGQNLIAVCQLLDKKAADWIGSRMSELGRDNSLWSPRGKWLGKEWERSIEI